MSKQIDWLSQNEVQPPSLVSVSSFKKAAIPHTSPSPAKTLGSEKVDFGFCKCGQPIKIPGLATSLCSRCGWVRTPDVERS